MRNERRPQTNNRIRRTATERLVQQEIAQEKMKIAVNILNDTLGKQGSSLHDSQRESLRTAAAYLEDAMIGL